MNCPECSALLNDLVDGELGPDQVRAVKAHLEECPECRRSLARLEALRERVGQLPKAIAPSHDLWPEIEQVAVEPVVPFRTPATARLRGRPRRGSRQWMAFVALAASVVVVLSVRQRDRDDSIVGTPGVGAPAANAAAGWLVTALDGAPRVDSRLVLGETRLPLGGSLETDAASRAKVKAGLIGEVELSPNSRLRLVGIGATDHRIQLDRGTINALIWSPPRIFFVDTPTATAIDLGCAYTLTVEDDGGGRLSVTSGYVALQAKGGREIIVPMGMSCLTRPGKGPGTPFPTTAPADLLGAVQRFDDGDSAEAALSEILRQAGSREGVMLWHLLKTAPASRRGEVFDVLARVSAMPVGVTRAGILAGDEAMHQRWGEALGLFGLSSKVMKVMPTLPTQ